MPSNAKRAEIALGILAGLMLLGALLGVVAALFFESGSRLFAIVNAALVAWLAVGLMRRQESVWILVLLYGAGISAFQLALGLGSRDPAALIVGALNASIVALLMWVGRNLPDEPAAATPTA